MDRQTVRVFLRQYGKLLHQLTGELHQMTLGNPTWGQDSPPNEPDPATIARAWMGQILLHRFTGISSAQETPMGDQIGREIERLLDRYTFVLREETAPTPLTLTPAILGEVFELPLVSSQRRLRGNFSTPWPIVRYMCRQSLIPYLASLLSPTPALTAAELYTDLQQLLEVQQLTGALMPQALVLDRALADLKICDPAIGTGVFALGMVQAIVQTRIALTPHLPPGQQTARTAFQLKVHTLQASIHGMDIHPQTVEMARLRLSLSLQAERPDPIEPLPDLQRTIRCHNFLLEPVLNDQNHFDILIGNPPYIRIHKQDPALKSYFKQQYETAQGDYDAYILFFEQGIRLLKSDGILAYITPDKFLIRSYGEKLRALLLQYSILEFLDVSRAQDIFQAAAYPLITILQKNCHTEWVKTKVASCLADLDRAESVLLPKQSLLDRTSISLSLPGQARVLEKILTHTRSLHHVLEPKQIFCGTPRARDYHRWQNYIVPEQDLSDPPSKYEGLRVLVCGHLKPYVIDAQKRVRTIGHLIEAPYFLNRDGIISQQRWRDFCETPKILIRGNDTRITAVLDTTGSVFIGIYGIKINLKIKDSFLYLLGLLNSRLYQWIFSIQNRSARIAGNFFSINSQQILGLPYPEISVSEQVFFSESVSKILRLTERNSYGQDSDRQAQMKTLQQDLDRQIYQLYHLSESEIGLIEQETEGIL
ncbi:hypothetical protein BST81_01945 [Leptolyngbya sp. 'hensonii']|uniref:Eco57I restriction-modification methylase domain-containing protein n=1 Tax=Leptolyngbya sp. 'hensonii' TaxID=1922337 RepID=UPI00094FF8F1|nr:Eco57I restriction-modification methylase domain-containing protein [Leptolyngbya sp. 'hensonii']OLP20214.1 hypothetical protein BST81_01945 [Leptolyngbya sp. 'hensonii']